ncbi:uncharacterized protein LOC113315057 isoform X2 [Papaver somniferum]|uniref:uncharacterized protein LOC113315057 isoform X2 n=1 Tax=Papaver somniferum TaxID=3469 RepID=UPI000E6FC923|nr:uncharacterized protein LOC113315057 isoform X2 [Papaver somniferum]
MSNGGDCAFLFDDSHSTFDRGKYFGNLILSSGFKSYYGFLDSTINVFANDTEIRNDSKMFVKMPKRESRSLSSDKDDILLQLKHGKMIVKILSMDNVYFELKFFFNLRLPTEISSHGCFKFVNKVIDRGKIFQLVEELSYFFDDSEGYLDKNTFCVIVFRGSVLLEGSNGFIFSKFPKNAAWNFWNVGVDHLLQIKMGKVGYNFIVDVYNSVLLDSVRSLFDRGKETSLLLEVSYLAALDSKFGHLMKMKIGGIQNAYQRLCGYECMQLRLSDQGPGKWGEAFSLMEMKWVSRTASGSSSSSCM